MFLRKFVQKFGWTETRCRTEHKFIKRSSCCLLAWGKNSEVWYGDNIFWLKTYFFIMLAILWKQQLLFRTHLDRAVHCRDVCNVHLPETTTANHVSHSEVCYTIKTTICHQTHTVSYHANATCSEVVIIPCWHFDSWKVCDVSSATSPIWRLLRVSIVAHAAFFA